MSRNRRRNRNSSRALESRHDGILDSGSGRGTGRDRLLAQRPAVSGRSSRELRQWYLALGVLRNVVDAPAEDSTRNWIEIRTNRDQDLNIARLIANRLEALDLRGRLTELCRQKRIYRNGALLYTGIEANAVQHVAQLGEAIPLDSLRRVSFLNVLGGDQFTVQRGSQDPLSAQYQVPEFLITGRPVHAGRVHWLVNSWFWDELRGVSVVETVLDAVAAQDTALWSLTAAIYELSAKVFRSSKVRAASPDQLAEFLAGMRFSLSSQSTVALEEEESLERIAGAGGALPLKDILDFFFESLASAAQIPKSRLMGNSQGVITAGQYDLKGYYDTISREQENAYRPIINDMIRLIVHEREGEVFRALHGNVADLDWEFDFLPLVTEDPGERSQTDLRNAQADQLYVQSGVLGPQEIRAKRFGELEEFSNAPTDITDFDFSEPAELNFAETADGQTRKYPADSMGA